VTEVAGPAPVVVTLLVAPRDCPKCTQCRALLSRLSERFGDRLACRILSLEDPEAEQFGVALPPMLLVGDFIAAAGRVPDETALVRLITRRLGRTC